LNGSGHEGDRTTLVAVTTHTVLHNLIFGCLLVFLIQWIFLGDLRSAIIVGVNIPFALFFAIILLVIQGEDANLLSVGAVDFGIIVDSAVILVENIFRNFQSPPNERRQLLNHLAEGAAVGPQVTTEACDHCQQLSLALDLGNPEHVRCCFSGRRSPICGMAAHAGETAAAQADEQIEISSPSDSQPIRALRTGSMDHLFQDVRCRSTRLDVVQNTHLTFPIPKDLLCCRCTGLAPLGIAIRERLNIRGVGSRRYVRFR
jgi:hypothetical protein